MKGDVPRHAKYPLVLKLWMFGKAGENKPIRSLNRLHKLSRVSLATLRKWRDDGWFDIDMDTVRDIILGKEVKGQNEEEKVGELSAEDWTGEEKPARVSESEDSTVDKRESDELFDSIIKRPIEEDMEEVDKKISIKRSVMLTEFPAGDKVLHDVDYFQKPGPFYTEKNQPKWLSEQLTRLRRISDKSLGQLESLVDNGRISSKSAASALTVAKESISLVARLSKDLEVDAFDKPLTMEERKKRVKRNQDDINKAVETAADDDISEISLKKRMSKIKKMAQDIPDDKEDD